MNAPVITCDVAASNHPGTRCTVPVDVPHAAHEGEDAYGVTHRWYDPEPAPEPVAPLTVESIASVICTAVYGRDVSTDRTDPRAVKTLRAATEVQRLIDRNRQ